MYNLGPKTQGRQSFTKVEPNALQSEHNGFQGEPKGIQSEAQVSQRLLASSKWAVRAGAVAAVEEVLQHSDGIQFSDAAKSLCEVLGGTLKGRWDGKQKAIEVHAALTKRIT